MDSSLLLSLRQDLVSLEFCSSYCSLRDISLPRSLTPLFVLSVCGAGELVGLEDSTERSQEEAKKHMDQVDWSQDAAAVRFVNIVRELGADKLFHKCVSLN